MTASALAPSLFPIARVVHDLEDTFTFHFDMSRTPLRFLPGQFNMLYAFGAGEVAISISGNPATPEIGHGPGVDRRLRLWSRGDDALCRARARADATLLGRTGFGIRSLEVEP
ncbi:hypothetical protein LZC95_35295 [Pendulispora brunnea]|uniref:Uncharacterized protein n=1 Tax=Pendulispora brunnea TaxID=2905690 RepID=A0ABZ2K2D0_9BACT